MDYVIVDWRYTAGDWAVGGVHWRTVCILLASAQRPELERGSHLEPVPAVLKPVGSPSSQHLPRWVPIL